MDEPEIKAIETRYKGYRFRSRLEARWAVFFDSMGIPYEYEREGFDLEEMGWYLPDFWLPEQRMWLEVKGRDANEGEKIKLIRLAASGQWWTGLLEGSIDSPFEGLSVIHFQGSPYRTVKIINRGLWAECLRCNSLGFVVLPVSGDELDPFTEAGRAFLEDAIDNGAPFVCFSPDCYGTAHQRVRIHKCNIADTPRLKAAYAAARGARFEHGEQG